MRGCVFVLDDNPMDIKIAVSVIEGFGFECHAFTEYPKAMEWLEANTPTLVFLDIQMPDISGYELIPKIKSMAGKETTPIIMISGKNQTEDVLKAIKLGANDYIVKPMDPMVLQEKLEKTRSSSDEFHSVDIGGTNGLNVYLSEPIKILSLSEFGIKIEFDKQIKPGENVQLTGLPAELFGSDTLLLRSLNCVKAQGTEKFTMHMTFVGMSESQRQIIRKSCRKLWVKAKEDAA